MNYKLRAESLNDVVQFIQNEYSHMKNFNMKRDELFPDVDFEFETDLTLDEIIFKLKNINDSHIMYQTIKPINEYTGTRNYEL
jgi:hypothetical protein